jgi:two-component system phosphate regulon response regulator PhoB
MTNQNNVLIIEDDPDIAYLIQLQLTELNNLCQISFMANDITSHLNEKKWSLIILDRMLPDTNGLIICHQIRQNQLNKETPVIFLTALGETDHVIEGLEAGADDYIMKPFDLSILKARVKSLLRRSLINENKLTEQNEFFILEDLKLDTKNFKAYIKNQDINLTPSEWTILKELFFYKGIVQNRDSLVSAIAGADVFVTPRTVDTHMAALRKKIGPYADQIETIRGIGYRLKD